MRIENNKYKILDNDYDSIKDFARRMINYSFINEVIKEVDENVECVFDKESMPSVKDTVKDLSNTLNKLNKKYRESDNDLIKYLLSRFDGILYNNFSTESVYCALYKNEQSDDEEYNKVLNELRKAFEKKHCGYKVLGTYNHKNKKIVLFTRNLSNNYNEYLSVFCHEYFHAIHHHILDGRNPEILNEYYHSVILESLATYFQIEYMKEKSINTNEKMDTIERNSPIFYPYSGCKYFYENPYSYGDYCYNISFNTVLELSLHSFIDALGELIRDHYEYEAILKKKNYTIKGLSNILSSNAYSNDLIKIYKVKQANSFIKESTNGYIFGGENHKMINNIKKGDIILHEYKKQIVAISIAKTDGYQSKGEFGKSSGYYAKCHYDILANSWDIDYHPQQAYIQSVDLSKAKHIIDNILNCNDMDAILIMVKKIIDWQIFATSSLEEEVSFDNEINDHIYLEWNYGYHSFDSMKKHPIHICINDRECDIEFTDNRGKCDQIHKRISLENYSNLIAVFNKYENILSNDLTPSYVRFPYGGVGSYKYRFNGKENLVDCAFLFESDDRLLDERARKEYNKVIDDIINQ